MQKKYGWLQIFADGGGDGGASSGGEGGAAATGVTPADAGQEPKERTLADVLRERGVPEEKLQKRAYQRKVKETGTPAPAQAQQSDAGSDAAQAAQQQEQKQGRLTWKQIMDDPEYSAEAQKMVQKRVAKLKGSDDAMKAMAPALEMLAQHYGLDPAQMDYAALSERVMNDDAYYQQRAIDLGVSVDVAKRLDQADRMEQARQREMEMSEQEHQVREHLAKLYQQGEALKQRFPGFDLDRELQNDAFARMTSPGVGLSVEDAFFAVHRQELMDSAKQNAFQALSSSIASGQARPNETGTRTSGTAPAGKPNMSKEHREELKARFRAGERITTDMLY